MISLQCVDMWILEHFNCDRTYEVVEAVLLEVLRY